jgi:hypothetical protein
MTKCPNEYAATRKKEVRPFSRLKNLGVYYFNVVERNNIEAREMG